MHFTPIIIRGKKRKYQHPALAAARAKTSSLPVQIASISTFEPKRLRKAKSDSKKKFTTRAMPTLDGLPQELLEIIFLHSMNIALPRCSHALGKKLSARTVTLKFTMQAFFYTVDHRTNDRDRLGDRLITSDASFQSEILSCRFFTYEFFLAYVKRAHAAMIKLRGKAWEAAGISIPGLSDFEGLWPFKFTTIPYLAFAQGFHIPEKLLHGPWTEDKASLLYTLVSFNGEIDWEGSMAGETAKTGIRQAITEENEHAVAALAVLLGVPKAITTNTLRHAVIYCGCNINILRHLLFNAQILAGEASDTLDFYDPALWAWADDNGHKGDTLKYMLKRAEAFDLEFYFEDNANWSKIVPFPYGGSKFDARTGFHGVVRELLVNLYRNYGRKITPHTDEMGDADITTSAWRLVEVGRVVLFNEGQFEGRLAVIVEIIDHKRVLLDGPSEKAPVPRQEIALAKLSLTPIVIPKLPRASGVGHVAKKWEEHKVQQKFDESSWAKKRAAIQKRRGLNDFERFKVMKMRKQARFEVQKTFAKIRASAKA
ncbi:60S ribosomal L14 [Pyrenophora seminiperda CCB06]|uniref:60S ribosomal L14 n=1 Tax=Pyrenophora seminiperda CCB06 TaxID=1302712 RepID=A0A3M7MI42_9PLEO|nr:60S ribosomal L14 [Pyrenophora seminiperda CCB06]